MTNGRIEIYTHSDSTTENKGAAIVKITTTTDFAARTDVFKMFCRDVAMHAYGVLGHTRGFIAGATVWDIIVRQYPELEISRLAVGRELGEAIQVTEIALLRL